MATKKERGSRLSLYDKVYRELDSTFIGAERQRNVPGPNNLRYDYDQIGLDNTCENLLIRADNSQRLDFAQQVAEYYGAKFERGEESWRRDPKERFFIKINIMD